MSQHDFSLANQSMAPFRQDLNNALLAIQTLSSGSIEPSPTQPFMFWVNSSTNVLYQRSSDNLSWMPRGSVDLPYFGLVPTGEVKMFAGPTAPPGFLVCDGTPINRTTYSTLFSVIGTTYGAGNGSTTFNLPNLSGRTVLGTGSSGTAGATAHTLGQKGGEETHVLTIPEMPVHSHTVADGALDSVRAFLGGIQTNQSNYGASNGLVNNTGGNAPHNNLPPYVAMNYIIKT
ncbi:MAG TPA: tail fiber protein [Coleofasciculaceae cyanobacterium]|jgi:microcystin-dependent protein